MACNSNQKRLLLKAGQEYESVIDSLRAHHKQYLRLQTSLGVRESHANQDGRRVIELPELVSLEEQENRIAEHLVNMAAELIDRPYRVSPYIEKETLVSLKAIKDRSRRFSPEQLAEELVNKYLSANGDKLVALRAAISLETAFGHFFREGATPFIGDVVREKAGRQWRVDRVTSLRVVDWLINLTAVLEERRLMVLLKAVDDLLPRIHAEGCLLVAQLSPMTENEYRLSLTIKQGRLEVYMSQALTDVIKVFIREHNILPESSEPQWFRVVTPVIA